MLPLSYLSAFSRPSYPPEVALMLKASWGLGLAPVLSAGAAVERIDYLILPLDFGVICFYNICKGYSFSLISIFPLILSKSFIYSFIMWFSCSFRLLLFSLAIYFIFSAVMSLILICVLYIWYLLFCVILVIYYYL